MNKEEKRKELEVRRRRRTTGHPPRLVLLPAQPHPDRLLHFDTGAGPVQNLVLHCKRERKER